MEVQRLDGLKYNLDGLTDDELKTIHGHLIASHAQVTADIETLETYMFNRSHPELPLDDEEEYPVVGEMGYLAVHAGTLWDQYIEATRDV